MYIFSKLLHSVEKYSKLYLHRKMKKKVMSSLTKHFEDRKMICKMRESHHLLEIERENCQSIKRDEPICCHCYLSEIEDENHE